jgi:hypothetical protein
VAAGMPGTIFSEALMLPLGTSNGVTLYLDGSKYANFERSDVLLGWCVKQHRPPKEKEASPVDHEDPDDKPTKTNKRKAGKKNVKPTVKLVKPSKEVIITHCLAWKDISFSWHIKDYGSSSSASDKKELTFTYKLPYLTPNNDNHKDLRINEPLKRMPYVWDQDMVDKLRLVYCVCKQT